MWQARGVDVPAASEVDPRDEEEDGDVMVQPAGVVVGVGADRVDGELAVGRALLGRLTARVVLNDPYLELAAKKRHTG